MALVLVATPVPPLPVLTVSSVSPQRGLSHCQDHRTLDFTSCQDLWWLSLDVVGIPEIGRLLGVSRQRVYQLIDAYDDFPQPLATLAVGRVWTREAIETWNRMHGDRPSGKHRTLRFDQ